MERKFNYVVVNQRAQYFVSTVSYFNYNLFSRFQHLQRP